MKRILFVLNNLIIGGVEKVCYEIVKNVDRKKYSIDFLIAPYPDAVQYYEPLMKEYGCKVFRAPTIIGRSGKRAFLEYEKNILVERKYDVVHSHMDFMNVSILRIAKQAGVQTRISHVHVTYPGKQTFCAKGKSFIQRKLLCHYATGLLGCSREACIAHYGNNSDWNVFHNAFDIHAFLNLQSELFSKKLITIGRMGLPKNPRFIIEVIRELVALDPSYSLTYIGGGDMFDEVSKLVEKYNIQHNVEFLGTTPNILEHLESASMAIFPSVCEGLGIAIIEAQLAHCFTFFSTCCPAEANLGYAMQLDLELGAKEWARIIDEFVYAERYLEYSLTQEDANLYDMTKEIKKLEFIYAGNDAG